MKRIVSLLLAALTLSAAGCSKAPEALDMPSKTQSPVEQALPESGKRPDEIALPEAQTRQDQPVVTDQAEPEPDQTGAAAAAGRAAGGRPHNHGGKRYADNL